ncbi:MAG TPA: ABC transporter permease, partial [Anaerolineales bacterium]
KDMTRSFRSAIAWIFMFGVPLLMTGMFYVMLGNSMNQGGFDLPRTKLVIANLDEGGPKMQAGTENVPGSIEADTLGELVVNVLQSDDLADLLDVSLAPDASSARLAVDSQQAQVAIIIPADFSKQFADLYGQATVEFYQDPTLTISPSIVKSIMNQFMDRISGIKIAVDVALEQIDTADYNLIGQVIQQYLDTSATQSDDLAETLLEVQPPDKKQEQEDINPVLRIVGPIMGGMMIFYAFYTGASSAQSILREEEERTLPRLFTTPTAQATILSGKFLAVFLTVLVQMIVLLIAARLIFRIEWGGLAPVALMTAGVVLSASSFGIFINSMLKNTKQSGAVFGGVLTMTGMIGMISVFAVNSPAATRLGNSVSLMVPQGWAVRALLQSMNGQPVADVLLTTLVMLAWGAVFFIAGVWRFNHRYV